MERFIKFFFGTCPERGLDDFNRQLDEVGIIGKLLSSDDGYTGLPVCLDLPMIPDIRIWNLLYILLIGFYVTNNCSGEPERKKIIC